MMRRKGNSARRLAIVAATLGLGMQMMAQTAHK